jgi:selenocysteine lyase/cysteine desulfurase
MPVDVRAIGCDFLAATGRKYLRGPRGTGFLYVRKTMLEHTEPPFIDLRGARWSAPDRYELRSDARRYENWESCVAGQLGLGVATDYAQAWGLDAIAERVGLLAEGLRHGLAEIPGVAVRDLGRRRSGIVSFTVEGIAAGEVERRLRAQAINVATSSPASTLLDARARALPDLVRASVHYYNSEAEVARFLAAVAGLARRS